MGELLASPSGMASGQIQVLNRGPLSTLGTGMTRVGAKHSRIPSAAGGLFIIGQQQFGDFSGTAQQINSWRPDESPLYGSGGPARLMYGPTGTDTVVAGGRLPADGSTTQLRMELLSDTITTWNHKLAIRSMWKTPSAVITAVDWDESSSTLTKAGLAAAADFTGFTWAHVIVPPTGGVAGWYPVIAVSGADSVLLAPCRKDAIEGQSSGGGTSILGADATGVVSVQFHPSNQTVFVDDATWVDTATFSITSGGAAADSDTFTIGATVYEWKGTAGASPQVQIGVDNAASIQNAIAVLAGDPTISVVDFTDESFTIRSTSTATYAVSESTGGVDYEWDVALVGNRLIIAASGTPFSAYAKGPDDTLELGVGIGIFGTSNTYTRVNAKVSSTTLQVDDDGIFDPGTTDIVATLWMRSDFEHVDLRTMFGGSLWTLSSFTLTNTNAFTNYVWASGDRFIPTEGSGWNLNVLGYPISSKTDNSNIVLVDSAARPLPTDGTVDGFIQRGGTGQTLVFVTGTPLSFTPRQLDFYYLYVDSDSGNGVAWNPLPRNNPEEAPTVSQLTSKYCAWPQGSLSRAVKSANRTQSGFGNLPASVDGSLMNHAWWGNIVTTPRTFLSGDELRVRIGPIDTTYNNTPFLIEVTLIPNFDPERHWKKTAGFENNNRLLDGAVAFQSPPFTSSGARPTTIEIIGVSGAVQTTSFDMDGDNISHEWACKFYQGPASSGTPGFGALEGDPHFPAERRYTKTILLAARAANASMSGTTLIKNGAFIRYGSAYDGDVFIVEHGVGWKQGAYYIDADAYNAQTVPQRKSRVPLIAGQLGMGTGNVTGYIPDRTDFHNTPVHWQLFIQAVHPAMRGKMGYHGNYPGEPFSCTTGNGGVMLGFLGSQFVGTQTATVAPTGPRFRCSSFGWEWKSGLNP